LSRTTNIFRQCLRAATVLTATLLLGCASFRVADTPPLSQSKLEPLGGEAISSDGYRLDAVTRSGELPDLLILVAMSGGGKRSAAFAYGALKGMREASIPLPGGNRPLLSELDGISGVSGGSFTAAYYGLYRDKMFGQYEKDFLYSDTNSYIFGIYLLPWNWAWIVDPRVGTNDYMEHVYDETMFHGATYSDLMARGRPIIAIGATDINYGNPFIFTQEVFDVICSDLTNFPLARAVAASNGFPGLFSPVTLTNRAEDCGGRKPGWERRVTATQRRDPLSRLGVQANLIDRYLDPRRTRYVHLADGGISDNLSLRVAGSMMQNLAQSPAAVTRLGYDHLRRILVISVDGQGAQDSSVAQHESVGGLFSLFGLVSGGQIDRYNFETLNTVTTQIQDIVRTIGTARCAQGRIIDGAACDDVQGKLVHISLASMPDGPEKNQLLAIPTGLTLQPNDVDLLVAAGQTAVTTSEPLRQFLDNYPVRPIGPAPRRVRAKMDDLAAQKGGS
jgi:NTE family protein